MSKIDYNNLKAFIVVAQARSFTKAAAQLGVSQSALSHTISRLEAKLGVRLLARTTRGVSLTEAGQRLVVQLEAHYEGIERELAALSDFRDRPAGTIRITASGHPAEYVIWPKVAKFLQHYPDIKVEISVDYDLVDIVQKRFDAGVRHGDQVASDMIAVRMTPDLRMIVVGSPLYFESRARPKTPEDLIHHECINLRLPTHGRLYSWELQKDGQSLQVQVEGQLIFNTTGQILKGVLAGYGLAILPEDMTEEYVRDGRLIPILEEWWPTFPGYHLYYSSRRQLSPAFALLLDVLRLRS